MRNCHLKKSKQTSVKNNSYKSPTKFLQNCRRLDMATIAALKPPAADLPRRHSPYLENKCSSLSMPSAADLSRPFQRPPENSRFAGFLLDSEVIQRVEIAESSVKRAFRGVLSNRNMVDYATVQSDECPNRTARPERPFPDGPAAVRLSGTQGSNSPGQHSPPPRFV